MDERRFLNEAQKTYTVPEDSFESKMSKYIVDTYNPYIMRGGIGLELGCATGFSTNLYAPFFSELSVIEGSGEFMLIARENVKYNNVRFRQGLFEDISEVDKYDAIIANYVLEHIASPEVVIGKCYNALKKGGTLLVAVPNALSLSRQMAVEMGLLDDIFALTENDLNHGHRRVYDMKMLINHITSSPFTVIKSGGVFIKPFASFQMMEMIKYGIIGEKQLDALVALAEKYPEISGTIYAIARK